MSSSVVDQLQIEMPAARRPCQDVAPSQQVPSAWTGDNLLYEDILRTRVAGLRDELHQRLIQHDVIQHTNLRVPRQVVR